MTQGSRILIAEDEAIQAMDLTEFLKDAGLEIVGTVDSGDEAVAKASEIRPDLVLMDVKLRGDMDGIQAATEIRSRFNIPILYLTAHADAGILERAKISEPYAYLIKPWSGKELLSSIEMALYKSTMEQRLRESEERLRSTLSSLDDLVFVLDKDGVLTDYHLPAASPDAHFTNKERVGEHISHVLPAHVCTMLETASITVAATDTVQQFEYPMVKEEIEYWFSAKVSRRSDSTGAFAGVTVVSRDVTREKMAADHLERSRDDLERRVTLRTAELAQSNEQLRIEIEERKKAERAAREGWAHLYAVFETAPDSICIKDRSLKYTLVNPSFEKLLALPSRSIMGKTDDELFGREAGHHLREVDLRVLRGETIEEEHTRPVKGDPTTFLDIRAPMRNSRGEIIAVCGISRNITERKETQTFTPFTADEYPSPAMRATLASANQAAETDSIVMLTGESGSGKDFLARYIHDRSGRSGGSFYSINCAAIARELAESELFGHESGAFTGASRRKRGLVELAEGGTLLLNEIGELQLPLQAKLLSFLDAFSFTRVGGEESLTVNARLIAATNRDLEKEVEAGRFRADLYYRLNVFAIRVPALRERLDDVPILVYQILSQLAQEMHLPILPSISPSAVDELSRYRWPGNVRELRNVIERAVILSKGPRLSLDFLGWNKSQTTSGSWTITFPPRPSLPHVVQDIRRELVQEALSRADGNKQEASRLLGISRYTLRRQMKGLGLDVPK